MTNLINKVAFLLFFCILFTACTKTITPKLPNGEAQLVIEGTVSDTAGPYYVNISNTVDFYSDGVYPSVSGAEVTITDLTAGFSDSLTETAPGQYMTHAIVGTPGNTYSLKVQLGGVTYTAQSTMPIPVAIDTVTIDYSDGTDIEPMVSFQDPANAVNYYKLNTTHNGVSTNHFQTEDDQSTNGRLVTTHVDQDTGVIKHGDMVTVYLVGIDYSAYQFLHQAEQIAFGNSNLLSPATPTSNISGGCVGYFSAQTVRSKSTSVK